MSNEQTEKVTDAAINGLAALITAFFDGILPFAKENPWEFALCFAVYGILPLLLVCLSGGLTWSILSSFLEEQLRKVYNSFPSKLVSVLAPLAIGILWCFLGSIYIIPPDFDPTQAEMTEIGLLILKSSGWGCIFSGGVLLLHFFGALCLNAHKENKKKQEKRDLEEKLKAIEKDLTNARKAFHAISRQLAVAIEKIARVSVKQLCQKHFDSLLNAHERLLECEKECVECRMKVDK